MYAKERPQLFLQHADVSDGRPQWHLLQQHCLCIGSLGAGAAAAAFKGALHSLSFLSHLVLPSLKCCYLYAASVSLVPNVLAHHGNVRIERCGVRQMRCMHSITPHKSPGLAAFTCSSTAPFCCFVAIAQVVARLPAVIHEIGALEIGLILWVSASYIVAVEYCQDGAHITTRFLPELTLALNESQACVKSKYNPQGLFQFVAPTLVRG